MQLQLLRLQLPLQLLARPGQTVSFGLQYEYFPLLNVYRSTDMFTLHPDIFKLRAVPRSEVLLDKLTVAQLVKKFSTIYGTRRLNTVFTTACHSSLS
jgi:hypothetical protein